MKPHTLSRHARALVSLGGALLLAMGLSSPVMTTVPALGAAPTYFSEDGKQTTDFGDGSDGGTAVAVQPDGKTVVLGTVDGGDDDDMGLARYNGDGTLDDSFGGGGTHRIDAGADESGNGIALQSDGKILVTGDSSNGHLVLARYTTNGQPDGSFAGGGISVIDYQGPRASGSGVAIQTGGKIVVGGTLDLGTGAGDEYMVARFNSNGDQDFSFGDSGMQLTDMGGSGNSAALQSDDKIVVAGSTGSDMFGVVRYNSDGSIDNTFSGDGMETTDFTDGDDVAKAVAIQSDGRIVVAGVPDADNLSQGFALARYDSDGTLDNTFSGDGIQVTGYDSAGGLIGNALAIQADGKIVVAGATSSGGHFKFALSRYNTDGDLDNTFSGDGSQTTEFEPFAMGHGAAVSPDGKITVAGVTYGNGGDFAVARYNSNGSLDARPEDSPPTTDPDPEPDPAPVSSRACTITGTARGEVIHGTSGRDVICARGGADVVYGHGGNDLIFGHRGNDRLIGGAGNDRLHGARGRDKLVGGSGSDLLRGGLHADRLNTRDHVRGNDSAYGGYGNDSCTTNRRDLRRSC